MFSTYLSRGLFKPWLIFARINGPKVGICIRTTFFIQPRPKRTYCARIATHNKMSRGRLSYYSNSSATFNILLNSGDIECNPGPISTVRERNRNKQNKTIPVLPATQLSARGPSRRLLGPIIHRQLVHIPIKHQQQSDFGQSGLCSKTKSI